MSANAIQIGGSHYQQMPIQPWDFITQNDLGFLEGCIVKYVVRHKDKGGLEDLLKARHFLDKLIELKQGPRIDCEIAADFVEIIQPPKPRRGRPPGSKNAAKRKGK